MILRIGQPIKCSGAELNERGDLISIRETKFHKSVIHDGLNHSCNLLCDYNV